jgi:hypothetical protein
VASIGIKMLLGIQMKRGERRAAALPPTTYPAVEAQCSEAAVPWLTTAGFSLPSSYDGGIVSNHQSTLLMHHGQYEGTF